MSEQKNISHAVPPGKVYLVGAGPGDPELITVKGLNMLRRADVVIYDNLVNPVLLDEIRADAEKIYVGKVAGRHTLRQEGINRLLIQYARAGKLVVRLKGGDPFVFGRGGEEAEALVENGIAWEVIPGVTSAVAVPAYAGIPVTHREYAAAFTVITGHEASEKEESSFDWEAIARLNGTLIVLMGMTRLPQIVRLLLCHGRATSTPVAVIRWGSMPMQQSVIGTLETIAEQVQQARLQPPALIIIGDVVRLSERLRWFAEAAPEMLQADDLSDE
jgi:uroporphyrinogen III methyltransferase/synthase